MAVNGDPAPRRRRLGQELRRLRELAEMNGEVAAQRARWSAAKVSRIETARTLPSDKDIKTLLTVYGCADEHLDHVLRLRQAAVRKGWWEKYSDALDQGYIAFMGLEDEATVMRNWEPQVVPGLLQTEDYARELIWNFIQPIRQIPPTWLRDQVAVRMRRQQRLILADPPLELRVVLDESIIHRKVGSWDLMREQLQHLIEVSQQEHIEMRILSRETQAPTPSGSFVHFMFRDFPETVYLEELTGARFIEDAGTVFVYERAFDHLMEVALDELASRQLIKETMKSWQA